MDLKNVLMYNYIIPYMEEIRMTFGKILLTLRKELGLKQEDIAKKIGVEKNTISNYENNISKPNYDKLVKLCNLFHVSPNYLMEDDFEVHKEFEIPLDVQQLKEKYNRLTDHDKSIVDYILEMEEGSVESVQEETQNIVYRFPVYEQQAAAGAGITGRDGKFVMCDIYVNDIPDNAVFGVHIKGNSMINTDPSLKIDDISDDAIVLLNPKVSVSDLNKTIVVASINNEVICKRFLIEQNCVHFYSLNRREHADDDKFAETPDDYRIIGQVVKVIKPTEYN